MKQNTSYFGPDIFCCDCKTNITKIRLKEYPSDWTPEIIAAFPVDQELFLCQYCDIIILEDGRNSLDIFESLYNQGIWEGPKFVEKNQ
jgi:hypothetical protein